MNRCDPEITTNRGAAGRRQAREEKAEGAATRNSRRTSKAAGEWADEALMRTPTLETAQSRRFHPPPPMNLPTSKSRTERAAVKVLRSRQFATRKCRPPTMAARLLASGAASNILYKNRLVFSSAREAADSSRPGKPTLLLDRVGVRFPPQVRGDQLRQEANRHEPGAQEQREV